MSNKYSMFIDIIVQRGYRQPLDIIDTFKLRWNILFPFRPFTDELLLGSGFDSIEQLTYHIMGKRHRASLDDNCLYISIGTASSFIKVLENIKNNVDRYITEELLEHFGTDDPMAVLWDIANVYMFFKKYLDRQATGEELVFRSWN